MKSRLLPIISSIIIGVVVVACGGGGGGGGGSSTSNLINASGVAIDGNLSKATVFLDLNNNGVLDAGEPSTTSNNDGTYTLSATQSQLSSYPVVVQAIAGTTIDSDNPDTPISLGFSLTAPAGAYSVISPLTTYVVAQMNTGLSLTDAQNAVATQLQIPVSSISSNYIASNTATVHNVAAAIAATIQNLQAQSSSNTTSSAILAATASQVKNYIVPNIASVQNATSPTAAAGAATTAVNNIYSVGGTISGLTTNGLVLYAYGIGIVSPLAGDSTFTFTNLLAQGAQYGIQIQSQPTGKTCTLSNASGFISANNITSITVTCVSNPSAIQGSISGLISTGLTIKNGTENLVINPISSSFAFQTLTSVGSSYSVSIVNQPNGQTCSLANAIGSMTNSGVNNVQITCHALSYSLGGSISGLTAGGLILQNGSDTYTLSKSVAYGGSYNVTVISQPAGLVCSLSNGSGVMGASNITAINITCAPQSFTLGGTVTGLNTSGLILSDGNENLTVSSASTAFQFVNSLASGSNYSISISVQPTGQTCLITSGASGNALSGNVSNIQITCSHVPSNVSTLVFTTTPACEFSIPNPSPPNPDLSPITIDSNGNLIWVSSISDIGSGIFKLNPQTKINCLFANIYGHNTIVGIPWGLSSDAQGNLYLTDNTTIKKIDPSGNAVIIAGSANSSAGTNTLVDDITSGGSGARFFTSIGNLSGIAVDPSGNGVIYVADFNNHAIRKLTPSFNGYSVVTIAGSQPSKNAQGIVVCPNNQILNAAGSCQGYQNGPGSSALFAGPSGIAVDLKGNIFVTEVFNNTVRKLTPTTNGGAVTYNVTTLAGPQPIIGSYPYSQAGSGMQAVYSFLNSSGYVDGAGANARFNTPIGIVIDSSGNLYIADKLNNRIRLINSLGVVSTLAGSGQAASVDGNGTSASINQPFALAIDSNNNIYISDNSNNSNINRFRVMK
jgi:hypothetical protein